MVKVWYRDSLLTCDRLRRGPFHGPVIRLRRAGLLQSSVNGLRN